MPFIASILGLILVVVLGIGGAFLNFWGYSFFAPRYEAVRNQVFHESQSYNDGMIRDLENLKMEYMQADAQQRAALRAIIIHRFSVYPQDRLPPNLFTFYNSLVNNSAVSQ